MFDLDNRGSCRPALSCIVKALQAPLLSTDLLTLPLLKCRWNPLRTIMDFTFSTVTICYFYLNVADTLFDWFPHSYIDGSFFTLCIQTLVEPRSDDSNDSWVKYYTLVIDNPFNNDIWAKISTFFKQNEMRDEANSVVIFWPDITSSILFCFVLDITSFFFFKRPFFKENL